MLQKVGFQHRSFNSSELVQSKMGANHTWLCGHHCGNFNPAVKHLLFTLALESLLRITQPTLLWNSPHEIPELTLS